MNKKNSHQRTIGESASTAHPTIEQLVEEHFDYLYNYAFRYFHSQDCAEVVVQDTFLAATQALSSFEGRSTPRTWLLGILRFKIIDQVRQRNRISKVEIEHLANDSLPQQFDSNEHWQIATGPLIWDCQPEKALNQRQFFSTLEQCLNKLPEKMRQIFLLRELDGFESEDICQQLALSSSNVRVLLHRTRIALQQCLQVNWFQQT